MKIRACKKLKTTQKVASKVHWHHSLNHEYCGKQIGKFKRMQNYIMKYQQDIDKLKDKILKNATHLKVSDLKISDRARLDASMLPPHKVVILYSSPDSKAVRCKYYENMPYKPLPNSVLYNIIESTYNWLPALFGQAERLYKKGRLILN